ncbi:MAG: hypothetical protein AXW14_08965 [Alteromonas sp. Nap_26]|nr:MAG: hypothetical protein AXW14_08965 [Alteromonas sp. Nap_26]
MIRLTFVSLLLVAFSRVNATTLLLDSQQTVDVLVSKSSPKIMSEELLSLVYPQIESSISNMQVLSHKRIERLLNSDEAFCTTNRLKTTERKSKYLFSHAIDVYSGLKLYAHKKNDLYLETLSDSAEQPVALHNFVSRFKQDIFAIIANYSYGDVLDEEISKVDESQLYVFESKDPFEDFIHLFLSKRVQFIVTYPEVMHEYMNSVDHDIVERDLKGEKPYRFGHVMCNKNEENQAFMISLNNALRQLYVKGVFTKIASKYLLPEQAEGIESIVPTLLE